MADTPELDPAAALSLLKTLQEIGMQVAEIKQAFASMNGDMIEHVNNSEKQLGALKDQGKVLRDNAGLSADAGQSALNAWQTRENDIKQMKVQAGMMRDQNGNLTDAGKAAMKLADEAERNNEAAGNAADKTQKLAATLTGVSGAWKDTVIGSFFSGDFNENLKLTAKALRDNFSVANILGSSLMKVAEATAMMVVSADSTFASVNQLTNGTGEYNDIIMDTMQNNAEWNVSMEDAGEAVGALYTDMSNFSNMTEEAQGHLVEATAQLKGLGIDAHTTAANFEILNGALGMSAEQATRVQKDFAAMAADLGVSAGKIAKDFEANSDVFTAYGENAVEVFKEVAAAAKATGIEMSALLGITTKFDTFEGAARAAGQLNAVLGGGLLNSMDLLNATEEERIRMLIQSVSMSGKQWKSMSKFEKQAVMNAAGISDMTTANKLFGQSLSEYDAAQRKVEDNAEAQEKLAERAAAAASVMDKMRRIMEQFAIAVAPIVNAIHFMLDGFLSLNNMLGGMLVPTLIGFLAVLAIVVYWQKLQAMWSSIVTAKTVIQAGVTGGLAGATAVLSGTQFTMAGSSTVAGTGSLFLAGGITAIGAAVASGGPLLAAFSLGVAGLGLAIAAPLIALSVLIWSLKELFIAMMEMPEAIIPALLGLMAFGAAAMIALPMLAMGIALFVAILAPVVPYMAPVAMGLMYLAAAAAIFGVAAWLLGQGFKALSVGIKGFPIGEMIGLGFALIPFGFALMYAGVPFIIGAVLVGIGALLLGFGLQALAAGIKGFTKRGMFEAMFHLTYMLIIFGIGLIYAAIPFTIGSILVGIGALLLGVGLMLLAKGISGFIKRGMFGAMFKLTFMLILFGIGLIWAAIPFMLGAVLIGYAALLLGVGLIVLAKGIKAFSRGSMLETMALLPFVLIAFGWGLAFAAIPLFIGGIMLLYGAIPAALALAILAAAVKPWMKMDFDKLVTLGSTLDKMTDGFMRTGFWLMFSGPMLLIGALTAGLGLHLLAEGVKPWMKMDFERLAGLGYILAKFAVGLAIAGYFLTLAAVPFFIGAVLTAISMAILAGPLTSFAKALAIIAPFTTELPAMAYGLYMLGLALPTLGWGLVKLGFAASMPFFRTGLRTLGEALKFFGESFASIPTEKAVALGQVFQGLAALTDMKNIASIMSDLAWGILMLAWAIDQIPEEKSIALTLAADAMTAMLTAAVQVTPEAVESVKTMTAAAADYATASRAMREPEKDALVQALREAMGGGKGGKGGKTGQDIVLEIDGSEFARAVDAAIDSRHSTSGW